MQKKLLIIEDDPFSQEFYKLILSKIGYNLTILEETEELLSFIDKDHPNLIILDINLKNTSYNGKVIDGIELLTLIKNRFNDKKIPVIIVTAYTNYKGVEVSELADDFIVKPISDFNILIDKVENLIG